MLIESPPLFRAEALMGLPVVRATYTLQAEHPLLLPEFSGSAFRGIMGRALKQVACARSADARAKRPQVAPCETCACPGQCHYAYLFETRAPEGVDLRGADEPPRPFVLRPPQGSREVPAGETFTLGLVLLGRGTRYWPTFLRCVQIMGYLGLHGQEEGGRFHLVGCTARDASGRDVPVAIDDTRKSRPPIVMLGEICGDNEPSPAVEVTFTSPARFKHHGELVDRPPEFHVLIRSLLRRLNMLAKCHAQGSLDAPLSELARMSHDVRLEEYELGWWDIDRWSSRQQKTHEVDGMLGRAVYVGEMATFLPLLAAGTVVHVGGKTTFGHGEYRLRVARPRP